MSIAPTSAEGSAAAWAAEAAGAAEAYVEAQANEAARQRDLEEKRQAQLAASGQGRTDGVDPPPPPLPAHQSFWANDPNRPGGPAPANGNGGSGSTAGSGGSGGGLLIPDGNGGYVYIPPDTASVSVTVTPDLQAPDFILPIGHSGGSNSSPVQPPPPSNPPTPDPQGTPGGPNEVNKPQDPEKPKEAPKIVSGLGDEVDRILNASKTLREQWEKLKADRWRIETTNEKSQTVYGDKLIQLNPADSKNPAKLAALVSHEIGHAVSGAPEQVSAKGRTQDDYVSRNVEARLAAEGEGAFENCRHREEIKAATGVDITIAGKNSDDPYLKIYEDFKSGKLEESEAKWLMGQLMGEEWEYRDGTTKRQAYTAQEKQDYEKEVAGAN